MWLCETRIPLSLSTHTTNAPGNEATEKWKRGRRSKWDGWGSHQQRQWVQSQSHGISAALLCLHMKSETAGRGERRSGCEREMCAADHTLCMACMVCTHHPNYTLTVTTPCRWHVNRQRGRREGGSLLLPSITHPAGTHHPSSHLLPPSPPPHLSLFTHHPFTHYHLH